MHKLKNSFIVLLLLPGLCLNGQTPFTPVPEAQGAPPHDNPRAETEEVAPKKRSGLPPFLRKKEKVADKNSKSPDTKVEDPKIEDPKIEVPKIEDPKIEDPKIEEPKIEEPKQEPSAEAPKVEEPKVEESVPIMVQEECKPQEQKKRESWAYKYSVFAIATAIIFVAGMIIISTNTGKKP